LSTDVIVALPTMVGTLAVLIWNVLDRRRSAFDAQMRQAADFLTGQTQPRSAGIAIIEGARVRLLVRRESAWRTAIIGLLCTQALYQLERSEQGPMRFCTSSASSSCSQPSAATRSSDRRSLPATGRLLAFKVHQPWASELQQPRGDLRWHAHVRS
jgi:hypothetical protein